MAVQATDYLIVGAGAVGLTFADQLFSETDAKITIVDRRAAPGGHWVDAYPFVRLHLPSAFYGVGSRELGSGRIDEAGFNKGFFELASLPEILAHFEGLMRERFLPSGRVTYLPMNDYLGDGQVRSRMTGQASEIAHLKLVDTTYTDMRIPSTHRPSFTTEGVRLIPPNDLPRVAPDHSRFTLLGGSKTAMDAGVWLLQMGVPPEAIRWVKPRESWLINRATIQPGPKFQLQFNAAQAAMLESAADAADLDDLFERLEAVGQLLRIDRRVKPTMYRGATLSRAETELLSAIEDVVRAGHVRHIAPDRLVMDEGKVSAENNTLYIDCTARAFARRSAVPIFDGKRITPQTVRGGVVCLSAALIAHVEATYADEATKNHLCPPVTLAEDREDWVKWALADIEVGSRWATDADLRHWIASHRLAGFRPGAPMPERTAESDAVFQRIRQSRGRAVENLQRLAAA